MINFSCRLYEKLNKPDSAAAAYTDFVTDEFRNVERTEMSHAYKFLTEYHMKKDQLDQANLYAQKYLQFDETKEEAKAFLRQIAQRRAELEENPMVVSNEFAFSRNFINTSFFIVNRSKT